MFAFPELIYTDSDVAVSLPKTFKKNSTSFPSDYQRTADISFEVKCSYAGFEEKFIYFDVFSHLNLRIKI